MPFCYFITISSKPSKTPKSESVIVSRTTLSSSQWHYQVPAYSVTELKTMTRILNHPTDPRLIIVVTIIRCTNA